MDMANIAPKDIDIIQVEISGITDPVISDTQELK